MQVEGPLQKLPERHAHGSWHRFFLIAACIVIAPLVFSGCAGVASSSNPLPATPQAAIVPSTVDFKNVVVGQKNTQTLQISNAGKETLEITQIQVSGKGFSLASNKFPISLQSGQGQNISLVFAPSVAGSVSGSLLVLSNDPHSPDTVPVAGTAEMPVAQLQANPGSISFGNEPVQTTASKNVTLTNTGNVNVTVNGITVNGAGFGFADLTPGFSLAPQQQVTFQVWFKPQSTGAVNGTLSLISSNLSSPVSMALSGDGTGTASAHKVTLDWNASTSAVSGYNVYRGGATGGPYARVSPSQVGGLSYADSSVNAGATYYYVVTAVDNAGTESSYSNEVSAAIPNP